ncbi:MAG: VanZ family protein [Thermodesulfovibrionales bacterium]
MITPLIAALIFIYQMERPEERVHFLEYGILGFLVSTATGTGSRHLIRALLLIVLIGSVDEFIQLLLPNRVGDLRDVLMNATGGVLGLWVEKFWSRR